MMASREPSSAGSHVPAATIYTQPGCIFCGEAKAWFQAQGIPFRERDLTRDETARDELARMGVYATPAIVVDGQVILGFNPEALAAALTPSPRPSGKERRAAATDQGP